MTSDYEIIKKELDNMSKEVDRRIKHINTLKAEKEILALALSKLNFALDEQVKQDKNK